jgi:hypothetical protein
VNVKEGRKGGKERKGEGRKERKEGRKGGKPASGSV